MRVLVVLFMLFTASVAAAQPPTPTPTITPVAGQDCCYEWPNPGCNDSACEACICVGDGVNNDPFCCNALGAWDYQCSQEAKGLYTELVFCAESCACSAYTPTPTPTGPTPTVTPTSTQTPTGTITPTPTPTPTTIPFLCCECPGADCQAPIQNVCPTPCAPVTPAICD
jgi:hypothetical protein